MQVKASGLRFDFAGIAGLTSFSPRSGVTFGVTYDTPVIFSPVKEEWSVVSGQESVDNSFSLTTDH